MSNAAKHRKKAAEFEQLKQIDRAIASYIRSIEESEAAGEDVDVALLNKVGDLALRQGRVSDAVTYYERAVEHYATAGLFNNAIALCNKILRSAPGRANVYFTLGRICAKKGLRGDATRNFLEYATRMQQDGRVDEGMRALSEVADLMPELTEVRRLVEEHAARVGIALPRKKTPAQSQVAQEPARVARPNDKSNELVFLDLGPAVNTSRNTPPLAPRIPTPAKSMAAAVGRSGGATASAGFAKSPSAGSKSLEDFMLFDPSKPDDFKAAQSIEPIAESAPVIHDLEPTSVETSDPAESVPSLLATEIDASAASQAPADAVSDLPLETELVWVDPSAVPPMEDVLEVERVELEAIASAGTGSEGTNPDGASAESLLVESALDEPFAKVDLAVHSEALTLPNAPESALESASIPYIDYVEPSDAEDEHQDLAEEEATSAVVVEQLDEVHVEHEMSVVNSPNEDVYGDDKPSEQQANPFSVDAEHETPDTDLLMVADDPSAELEAIDASTADVIDGLELVTDFSAADVAPLPDIDFEEDLAATEDAPLVDQPIAPAAPATSDSVEAVLADTDELQWIEPTFAEALESPDAAMVAAEPIDDLLVEEIVLVDDAPEEVAIEVSDSEAPDLSDAVYRSLTPISVSPIPELEAAIEAGALAVAQAEADPEIVLRRPPFRLDPHDFILPGELPPLALEDRVVDDGLARLIADSPEAAVVATSATEPLFTDAIVLPPSVVAADASAPEAHDAVDIVDVENVAAENVAVENVAIESVAVENAGSDDAGVDDAAFDDTDFDNALGEQPLVTPAYTIAIDDELARVALHATTDEGADEGWGTTPDLAVADSSDAVTESPDVAAAEAEAMAEAMAEAVAEAVAEAEAEAEEALRREVEASRRATPARSTPGVATATPSTPRDTRAVATTPSLPIAAVAAEASIVAASRRDELRAAVARSPQDCVLRRRLAEALFESGEREAGLTELQATLSGFSQRGMLSEASDIADELVHISPDRIQYHQKRVELAVRLNNQPRLQTAYLDLADTLVRTGDEVRAHAVYARVLELDPWDERARAALGSAAPPPPPKPSSDSDFVNLADWLREDVPATTRMRMPEPTVSGDEQADFDALLRHFKEGVSRSLGEEDYESHYDLGVAYKEMGLLDDAIAEFQKALRSRRHRLPAYEALGQCFVEQSRHSVAATVLTRALHEPGLGDEHRVGVLYLLAYSCEALQRWDEARSYYSRVYATDINFRDVAARLAALDQIAR